MNEPSLDNFESTSTTITILSHSLLECTVVWRWCMFYGSVQIETKHSFSNCRVNQRDGWLCNSNRYNCDNKNNILTHCLLKRGGNCSSSLCVWMASLHFLFDLKHVFPLMMKSCQANENIKKLTEIFLLQCYAHFAMLCVMILFLFCQRIIHIKIHGSIHITTKYPNCKSFE